MLIEKSGELVSVLEEINRKQIKEAKTIESITTLDFDNELTPAYCSGTYLLEDYSKVRTN